MIYADTETHAMAETVRVPRLVVSSFADDNGGAALVLRDSLSVDQVIAMLAGRLCFAGPRFDLLVWLKAYPEAQAAIVEALEAGRVHDVLIREKMIDHAYGARTKASRYDLGTVAAVRAGLHVDKEDPFRKLYGGLDGVPLEHWPDGAKQYAQHDATVLRPIFDAQALHAEALVDEPRQVQASVALAAQSARGIVIDKDRARLLDSLFAKRRAELEATLVAEGLARPKSKKEGAPLSRCEKVAKQMIAELAESTGQTYLKTPTGGAALSAEALELLHVPSDHALYAYRQLGSLTSKRTTYLEPLLVDAPSVHTSYDPCVSTNRTSSYGPNLQNLPRDVLAWLDAADLPQICPGFMYPSQEPIKPRPLGFRECLVPRPGHVFVISDWSMMELVCLAQTCLDWFGRSKLAEALQAGRDPHEELGGTIAGFSLVGHPQRKLYRTLAKAPNFGFPGGLGAARFAAWAMAVYGPQLAAGGIIVDEAMARRLKRHWLRQWPEMSLLAKKISALTAGNGTTTMTIPRTGYVRGGMKYTEASNSTFQPLAAAVAKDALFAMWKASLAGGEIEGSHPVLFVHDEIVTEAPEADAWRVAGVQERLMMNALEGLCPDVPGGVETMITDCYTK